MKKLNFAIFGALLAISLVTRALAETTIPWTKEGCESVKGTWVTANAANADGCDAAHCNGKNFCVLRQTLNWWSALIWCQSIGHKLAELEEACPNGLASSGTCANLNNRSHNNRCHWIATPNQSWNQYSFKANSIGGDYRTGGCFVPCAE